MAQRRLRDRYPGAERWSEGVTVIGRGLRFEGELVAKDVVVVGGRVEGSIRSEAMVHVLQGAVVNGDVDGGSVLVEGAVDGNITAQEQCELGHSGRVRGDIHGPRVAVAEGAYLKGKIRATEGRVRRFRERRH